MTGSCLLTRPTTCGYFYFLILIFPVSTLLIPNTPSLNQLPAAAPASPLIQPLSNSSQFETAPRPSQPWSLSLETSDATRNLSATLDQAIGVPRARVQYECDNKLFSLEASDCRQAWRYLPSADGHSYSFGNRTARQSWDVPLPFRSIGGEQLAYGVVFSASSLRPIELRISRRGQLCH